MSERWADEIACDQCGRWSTEDEVIWQYNRLVFCSERCLDTWVADSTALIIEMCGKDADDDERTR